MVTATSLLLTGAPGVGKTTLVRRVAEGLGVLRAAGFYTEERRNRAGEREGFELIGFDGSRATLARVGLAGPRVGKYSVDVAAVDAAAARLFAPNLAADLYLVDEIGKMECLSPAFIAAARRLLESPRPVVATVALKGEGFIAEVKQRADVRLVVVTHADRDSLPDEVLAWIEARCGLNGPAQD
ncbi:MAG: AAA family ATPase [Betaproteobacteria bacterium]|nr:AAA family ATPase [Betaproteobacteria bacterium]